MASSNMNDSSVYHNCAHSNSKFGQVSIYDDKDSLSSKPDLKPEWLQSKDASKRKRVNRIAKLKQCKLDARREQWLSQGSPSQVKQVDQHCHDIFDHRGNGGRSAALLKKQVFKCDSDGGGSIQKLRTVPNVHACEDGGGNCCTSSTSGICGCHFNGGTALRLLDNGSGLQVPEMNCDGNNRIAKACGSKTVHPDNDNILEVRGITRMHKGCSPEERNASFFSIHVQSMTRPDVKEGGESIAKEGHTGLDTSQRDIHETMVSSEQEQQGHGSTSFDPDNGINSVHLLRKKEMSKGTGDLICGNGHHENEDDWEAVADAIYMQLPKSESTNLREPEIGDTSDLLERAVKLSDTRGSQSAVLKSQCKYNTGSFTGKTKGMGGRAWRPDDAARPPSLPRLSKQHSFPHISSPATWREVRESNWGPPSAPLSCPICTEDLDVTDSSFVPCSCGFRLCLFCHHRITLEDGRCPGCRKAYNSDAAVQVSHTSSIWLHI